MSQDLLQLVSPEELKREVAARVLADQRSLPKNAKTFAAIVGLQGFDQLPEMIDPMELDISIAGGACELHRGITSTKGVQSMVYARDLVRGPMYPGTLSAIGSGIYFAEPSEPNPIQNPAFKRISVVAKIYATGEFGGVMVRAALKAEAKKIEKPELLHLFREFRNRAKRADILDVGAFAASLGFDAYCCDHVYDHTSERVWVVVNRGMLIFQKIALQIAPLSPILNA